MKRSKHNWNENKLITGKTGRQIRWWKSRLNAHDIRGGFNTKLYERLKAIKNA